MASILGVFQAAQRQANLANLQRYRSGMAEYEKVIAGYEEGGGFVKGQIAQLERRKTRGVAAGMQSLVSSGLAGTTMAAGLGKKWEEEVGTPARLSIADIAGQRLAQARIGKAGFIERRQDVGPDPSLVMAAMQGMGRASGAGGGSQPRVATQSTRRQTVSQPSTPWVESAANRATRIARSRMASRAYANTTAPTQPTPMRYSYGEQRTYA